MSASRILDNQVLQGGASRRAGGRDERPPNSSSPGATTTNAVRRWVPPSSLRRDAQPPDDRYNGKFRRVRGTLNRLTPEKFDKLSLELLNVGIDSQVVLKGIILLIFEKALDEPKYSRLYAQLCNRLCEDAPNFEPPDSTISTFKKLLLNKCQDEFENRSRATEEFYQKDVPLTADEEEQFVVAKHKMLGNIKFIGELGKLELLHEGILHKCIQTLLANKRQRPPSLSSLSKESEAAGQGEDLECLCKIMRTVGKRLDTDKARAWMDQYFERMKALGANPELPSRIRFLLQDTIEMRKAQWVPRKIQSENGPKTINQVRHEAAREFGINIPTPMSPSAHMMPAAPNMDLFGRPINNGGPRPGRMPPDMMFGGAGPSPMSPPFLTGGMGGIGMGPGTIHIDNFATGYGRRGGGGGNPNYRGGRGGGGGYNQQNRGGGGGGRFGDEQRFFPDSDMMQPRMRNNDGDRGGFNNFRNGNNRNDSYNNQFGNNNYQNNYHHSNQGNNYQHQQQHRQQDQAQKELDKIPPRFRKLQMQQQGVGGGACGTSPTPPFLGATEMNGRNTPPTDSRSPSHTPPPPSMSSYNGSGQGGKSRGGEEINLRPSALQTFTPAFRPNIPSMLPKSTQMQKQQPLRPEYNTKSVILDPPAPVLTAPQIIPIKKESKEKQKEKERAKKEEREEAKVKEPSKEEIKENLDKVLSAYLENGEDEKAIASIKELNPCKSLLPGFVSELILKTLDRSDGERDRVSDLLKLMKEEEDMINSDQLMEGLITVLDRMKSLEVEVPLVKSHMARLCAGLVGGDVVTLSTLAEPLRHGTHYPLFMLVLQQLHKLKDKTWLLKRFNQANINLNDMLSECERSQDRLMGILEDRGLSFLFPLLRIETELNKQLASDPNPTAVYKWIKENVDPDLYKDPGFINTLITVLVKYITVSSTLQEDNGAAGPDKASIDREKELTARYQPIMAHFLHDNIKLQVRAIYSMQVYVSDLNFPKGMLLRLFVQMYDNEVIDEEAFVLWKEEVNDEYPGKGKALFQVNTWLTWLEDAESESEEEDE